MGHDGNNTHGGVNIAKCQEKYNGPACTQCGHNNHPVAKCFATRHANGTVLNTEGGFTINDGDNDNDDIEVSSLFSDVFATVGHEIHELILFNYTNSQERRNSFSKGPIPGTWLLLDSQATIDVISNGELLTNIHHVKTTLHIRCNAGVHDAFVLMKGWTTTVNQPHHKVGAAFNTTGNDGNNTHGEVNIAKGQEKYNGPACTRCGHNNHPVANFFLPDTQTAQF